LLQSALGLRIGHNLAQRGDIVVRNGVVHLWGVLLDERQREAIYVVLENTPGVKSIGPLRYPSLGPSTARGRPSSRRTFT
jgi:hypothetical protein